MVFSTVFVWFDLVLNRCVFNLIIMVYVNQLYDYIDKIVVTNFIS